jgi:DNA polymerase-1
MKFPNLTAAREIILDTETDGPDWRRCKPVGYVVTWGPSADESAYWPTAHASGNVENPDAVRAWVRDLVARRDLRVTGHNLIFDLHTSGRDGIEVNGPVECTMVNMALIDEHRHTYNLEAVAQYYRAPSKKIDIYGYIAQKFGLEVDPKKQRSLIGHFWKLDGQDPMAQEYARGDGTATWHVRQQQQRDLDADDLRAVWDVECRLIRVLFQMERRGVRVDLDRLARVKVELQRMRDEALRTMKKGFNPLARKDVEEYLVAEGVDIDEAPKTATGLPSYVEAWLQDYEAGERILTVRRINNLFNSFIDPLEERHLLNGRIHCDFNQLRQDDYGTISGRLSSSNPNMQQIPKRNKALARLFRSVFLPESGHLWGSADYSQCEFRIFADYSEAAVLVEGYNKVPPVDIHQYIADSLQVERDPTAKRLNLGMLYGMGILKLARSLKIDKSKATEYRSNYDRFLPEARTFLKSAEFWARKRGWVRTKLRRRARFPDMNICHKAGSRIIQGTNADIIKVKNVEVAEYLTNKGAESAPTLTVHDELTFTVHPDERVLFDDCLTIMQDFSAGQRMVFKVPMKVDAHTGRNWAEATFPDLRPDVEAKPA